MDVRPALECRSRHERFNVQSLWVSNRYGKSANSRSCIKGILTGWVPRIDPLGQGVEGFAGRISSAIDRSRICRMQYRSFVGVMLASMFHIGWSMLTKTVRTPFLSVSTYA